MNRIFSGTLIAIALAGSAAAATVTPAATTTPATVPVKVASVQVNYGAECKTLHEQWDTASASNATNAKFVQAKAGATKAGRNCASTKTSLQRKGAGQFQSALKLIGVTPSI